MKYGAQAKQEAPAKKNATSDFKNGLEAAPALVPVWSVISSLPAFTDLQRDYHQASPETYPRVMVPFRQGLNENGFVQGQNVAIEYRWADGKYDRLPALAADLIGQHVTVICAALLPAALAAKAATATVPIVFVAGSDPVQSGVVTNLTRPSGNITGVSVYGTPLVAKRLELLREVAPTATVIGVLVNPN